MSKAPTRALACTYVGKVEKEMESRKQVRERALFAKWVADSRT